MVSVVSMDTLLRKLPPGVDVDLVKMDIEGGEGPLLQENLGWLPCVKSLIVESAVKNPISDGFELGG